MIAPVLRRRGGWVGVGGTGVLVGSGVAVGSGVDVGGAGVLVGRGVSVGTGVGVGGRGVSVGVGVYVGSGVDVGVWVGVSVGEGVGVAVTVGGARVNVAVGGTALFVLPHPIDNIASNTIISAAAAKTARWQFISFPLSQYKTRFRFIYVYHRCDVCACTAGHRTSALEGINSSIEG